MPTRRRFLAGSAAGAGSLAIAAALAACSQKGESVQEGVGNGPEHRLQALFPRDVAYLAAASPFRLPYTIIDAEGIPLSSIQGPLSFEVSFDGEPVGDAVQVPVHDAGVPRPYMPLPFTFPHEGIYDISTEYAGTTLTSQVQVVPTNEVLQPLVGQALPPASTPTVEQSFDVDPICTLNPQCPFHQVDLTDALAGDKPVVVLLASPAYCQTTACGPILDLLIDTAGGRDDIVVIHAEIYENAKTVPDISQATLAPLPLTYQMTFEPCLFVTDATHTLVARGDVVVDSVEMEQMLALAV